LPFCRVRLVGKKPEHRFSTDLMTLGDHLRKRRLDLHHQPVLHRLPAIAAFLGYDLDALPADAPLGLRIASKRRRLGLSQKALAESLGIDEGTVRRWERGESQRRPSRRVRGLFERWLAEARSLLQAKGSGEKGGKRRFRNGVGFVLPVKSHSDQVRLLALQGDVGRRAMSNGALDTVAGKSTTGAWEARNARNTHSQATLRA
jgi:Helix-turn-helix